MFGAFNVAIASSTPWRAAPRIATASIGADATVDLAVSALYAAKPIMPTMIPKKNHAGAIHC